MNRMIERFSLIANQQLGPGSDSFFANCSILELSQLCSSYDKYDALHNEPLLQYDDSTIIFIALGRQGDQIQRDKRNLGDLP